MFQHRNEAQFGMNIAIKWDNIKFYNGTNFVDCYLLGMLWTIWSRLRGRRSKGKGKGIKARDRARGRREEGNACKEAIVFAILPTNYSKQQK